MHDYIAQQLHHDRAGRLRAEAAADRLARSAVRPPENGHPRRPWWRRHRAAPTVTPRAAHEFPVQQIAG
jgi:hypothetical protein